MKSNQINSLGQPIGADLPNWQPCPQPMRTPMQGHYCDVVPLDPLKHAQALFNVFLEDPEGRNWTYLFSEPHKDFEAFKQWLQASCCALDPLFHVVIDKSDGKAVGMAAFMRIEAAHGVIEVGNIHFSSRLQQTPLSTEAMFLMMHRVFDELGYRRYEWKCDNLNAPSIKAAQRLGFTFEGVFRQALIYKNRNRDTAWFSMLDSEWPQQKIAFERWLGVDNFDSAGVQKRRLQEFLV